MDIEHLNILYRIKTESGFVSDKVREAVAALMESKLENQASADNTAAFVQSMVNGDVFEADREFMLKVLPLYLLNMTNYTATLEQYVESLASQTGNVFEKTSLNGQRALGSDLLSVSRSEAGERMKLANAGFVPSRFGMLASKARDAAQGKLTSFLDSVRSRLQYPSVDSHRHTKS